MKKTCSKCGQTKDIKYFRFLESHRLKSDICKDCELKDRRENGQYYHIQAMKRSIQKNWADICIHLDPVEVDQFLFSLKAIYRSSNEQKEIK